MKDEILTKSHLGDRGGLAEGNSYLRISDIASRAGCELLGMLLSVVCGKNGSAFAKNYNVT